MPGTLLQKELENSEHSDSCSYHKHCQADPYKQLESRENRTDQTKEVAAVHHHPPRNYHRMWLPFKF